RSVDAQQLEVNAPTGRDYFGGLARRSTMRLERTSGYAELDQRVRHGACASRTQALGVRLVDSRGSDDGDTVEFRVTLGLADQLSEHWIPMGVETRRSRFERDHENNFDGRIIRGPHWRIRAAVLVLDAVVHLRLVRAPVADISDTVPVVVEIGTTVRVLEAV